MKNRSIEAYRFLFSIVIALYHLRAQVSKDFLQTGYIVVEFFFILSGFLIARSLYKYVDDPAPYNVGEKTLEFIKKKIFGLYPHYLLSLLFCWVIAIRVIDRFTMKEALLNGWTELFMLQMTGLNTTSFTGNSADWYVSSLMLASFLCGFLLLKYRKTFLYVLAPTISVGIYVYLYRHDGHLGTVRGYMLNMLSGTLRGVAGICMGCICYCLFKYLSERYEHTIKSKVLFTFFDLFCVLAIYLRITAEWKTKFDFMMVPVFCGLIVSVFLKASYLSDLLDNKLSQALGGISYAIFLNHTILRDSFKQLEMDPVPKIALFLGVTIVLSILSTALIKKLEKTRLVRQPLALIFREKKHD